MNLRGILLRDVFLRGVAFRCVALRGKTLGVVAKGWLKRKNHFTELKDCTSGKRYKEGLTLRCFSVILVDFGELLSVKFHLEPRIRNQYLL